MCLGWNQVCDLLPSFGHRIFQRHNSESTIASRTPVPWWWPQSMTVRRHPNPTSFVLATVSILHIPVLILWSGVSTIISVPFLPVKKLSIPFKFTQSMANWSAVLSWVGLALVVVVDFSLSLTNRWTWWISSVDARLASTFLMVGPLYFSSPLVCSSPDVNVEWSISFTFSTWHVL